MSFDDPLATVAVDQGWAALAVVVDCATVSNTLSFFAGSRHMKISASPLLYSLLEATMKRVS